MKNKNNKVDLTIKQKKLEDKEDDIKLDSVNNLFNQNNIIEQQDDYLPINYTRTELLDTTDLCNFNPSFYDNVMSGNKINMTHLILDELNYIMNGAIPRNFVLNFRGLIGRKTGVFKSSFALQLAFMLDPTFNIKERVGFTANKLNELIKKYSTRKQIFFLDEQTHDLKQSASLRLANIIEACRERQLCFILVGVDEMRVKLSDYCFERLGESDDKSLPDKTIFYAIKKIFDNRTIYRGYFKWNVTPLINENWKQVWNEYMIKKTDYEQNATNQSLTGLPIESIALNVYNNKNFKICLKENKQGKLSIETGILKNLIYKQFPDVTNEERSMLLNEVKLLFRTQQDNKFDNNFDESNIN